VKQARTNIRIGVGLTSALLILCALLFAWCPTLSWADEEETGQTQWVDSSNNIVNVNQMPDSSFLYNTDIAELSDAEAFHDTQEVQVQGEVVGDLINDESNAKQCWITLQSMKENDSSVVSVLMTHEQASLIDSYGNYHVAGTELQVRGMFYLSCSEHQGISDIHAEEVTVAQTGEARTQEANPAVLWTGVLAVGLGLVSLFTYVYMRDRRR
jgi:hypothetical protein